jgi:hypothetical protein
MNFRDWGIFILLGAGLGAVGCSTEDSASPSVDVGDNTPAGSIRLGLDVSPGVTVDSVDYEITAPDIQPISGTLDVSSIPGDTFSAIIAGIPAGQGRTLSLVAQASGGSTCGG